MRSITTDKNLVAYCGLYCGACGRYLKEQCPGCPQNEKATWCKIRVCCRENKYTTCAECSKVTQAMDCGKFNNLMAKIFGFVFRSNRAACVAYIKDKGIDAFAQEMAGRKRQSMPR
jgi:hypothetical protein